MCNLLFHIWTQWQGSFQALWFTTRFAEIIEIYCYCSFWIVTYKASPWWPMKGCRNLNALNLLDCWKRHFQGKILNIYPSLKGFSSWKCIKYRNFAVAIKYELLKWNRLEIEFLTPNNSSKKCLQNPDICQAALTAKHCIFSRFYFQ